MNIFAAIMSTLFMILGVVIWLLAMLIIIVGALGVLRVTVKEVFEIDIIKGIRNNKLQKYLEHTGGD